MIFYHSTRGDDTKYKFSEVVLKGIAPDGGLFVPTKIPKTSENILKSLVGKSYQALCFAIFNLFQTDFSSELLKKIIKKSYASDFDNPQIAPLICLKDNQYILELWHGPTAAFKDMALQIMPLFFSEAAEESSHRYIILAATSGDTGKAALEGFKNKKGVKIIAFYPIGKVSKLQELQMITQEGNNVAVYGMKGNFDDVQRRVKEVFNDRVFNQKLFRDYNTVLSSANSINWGRLLPQIVYHVNSYLELINKHAIDWGDQIDIAVPTGNFGNILAAFYAKKMGLPVRKLICASNENNILTEFIQTGVYDISHRLLKKTPSPSIDIIVASNIERLLYELTKDSNKVSRWMKQLKDIKRFVSDKKTKKDLQSIFYADWVSNADSLITIKKAFDESNYLMDPHTAVAKTVADRFKKKFGSDVPMMICSTAHWSKFPKDVFNALTGKSSKEDEFEILRKITRLIPHMKIPKNITVLKNKQIRHTNKCVVGKKAVEKIISQYLVT